MTGPPARSGNGDAPLPRCFVAVSPHLDDAALSCGSFLAAHPASLVVTVFAGGPSAVSPLPDWDRLGGRFADGDDVVAARRAEDERAAGLIGAKVVHLDHWDSQYRGERHGYPGPRGSGLLDAIGRDLRAVAGQHPDAALLIPLGIGHSDHRAAGDAALEVAACNGGPLYVYEELPYALERPGEVLERWSLHAERGFTRRMPAGSPGRGDRPLKRELRRCYASQRRSLGRRGLRVVWTRERIWRMGRGDEPGTE